MALSLAACGGSSETVTTPVDITSNDAQAILNAVTAVDSGALTVQEVADRAQLAGMNIEAQATVDAINELLGANFTTDDSADTLLSAVAESDNDSAISIALREAAAGLDVDGTSTMTNAELILAIKTANDDAVEQAVDIQTDNAAAITAALKSAADELNVEGTSAMTDAELITAIKTANDEVVKVSNDTEVMISDAELAIRVAADNDTATNTAVSNATAFDTLAELLEAYNNLANPASFTLTTGVNNFSTTRTESVAFDASTVNSLSNGDVLSGGSATDTLTANLSNITVSVNSTGIEVFTLNVAAAGAATLDMTDVTGLTTVNNVSSLNNLTLNNLGMLPSLDLNTNSAVTTLNFSNAAMSGGTDDLAITLNGTTSGATINLTSVAGSANTIETVSVVSASVPNTIDLNTNAVGATTVEVTGSQNLDLGTVESLVATVSAGDFTGNLTMTAGTAGTAITSGAGADILTGNAGSDNLITGDGIDTVNMTNGGDDQVNLGAGADNLNDAENIAAADTVVGGAGSDTLTFGDNWNVGAADLALTSGFDVIALEDDTGNNSIQVGLDDTVVGASDSDTITINGAGTNDTVTLTAAVSAGNTVILGDDGASFTLAGNTRATIGILDSGTADGDLSNETSTAVSLGAGDEILTGSDGQDTVNMTNGGDDNVSLGAGADNLNDAENIGAADVIVGGAGSDTLTFSDDSDVAAANLALTSGFDVIALEDDTNDGAITVGLDDTVVGASDSDTITINGAGTNDTVTLTAAVSAGNTVILGDDGASFTLAGNTRATIGILDSNTADGDLSNETSTTVTLGAGNEIVTGSDGQDTVVLGTGAATVSLGAGVDTFSVTDADLTGFNVLNGGDGDDVLSIIDDTNLDTIVDNDFTGKTSIEALTLNNDDANSITLGSKAAATGIATVTLGSGDDDLTVDSGYTGSITVDGSANGANTISLANSSAAASVTGGTGVDTITAGSGDITIVDAGADADVIVAGSGTMTITDAGAGADVVTGSTGALIITDAGAGADEFTVSTGQFNITAGADGDVLIISNGDLTSDDTFAGGAGSDVIRIDNATTLVDKDFTNVTSTFTLNSAVADVALDVTLGAEANEAGLVDIDGGTASDVIDGAGMTLDLDIDDEGGNNTITGGAGNDNIATGAGADSITGGAGNDTLSGGNGADIYVFSSTGALNGDDTITFVQADDRLDFSSFLSGGSVENNTVPVAATGTDDIQLNNKLIILDDASADLTATEVAAAIEGIGDAMELSDGGKGIVIVADAADANSDMSIFYVDDSLGANVGTVELDDVVLVGQSSAGIDADSLANGNFIF